MDFQQLFFVSLVNFSRYFLFAGLAFLIFYKLFPKYFSSNKIQKKWAKQADFIREIKHSIQTIIVLIIVGFLILKTPLRDYTQFYTTLEAFPIWWIPVSVVLALVVHDSYFYWMHRSVHHPAIYAKVHRVHHQSTNPSPWASYAFHFYEAVLEAMIAPILLFLIPMHPLSLLLFTIFAFMINVYGHLGFEIAPKWFRRSFLFEILNTSVHHNLHHEKFKGNYGLYFRVWDRFMKTEHPDYVKRYDQLQQERYAAKTAVATTVLSVDK